MLSFPRPCSGHAAVRAELCSRYWNALLVLAREQLGSEERAITAVAGFISYFSWAEPPDAAAALAADPRAFLFRSFREYLESRDDLKLHTPVPPTQAKCSALDHAIRFADLHDRQRVLVRRTALLR